MHELEEVHFFHLKPIALYILQFVSTMAYLPSFIFSVIMKSLSYHISQADTEILVKEVSLPPLSIFTPRLSSQSLHLHPFEACFPW